MSFIYVECNGCGKEHRLDDPREPEMMGNGRFSRDLCCSAGLRLLPLKTQIYNNARLSRNPGYLREAVAVGV